MARTNKYASINFNDIYEKKSPATNNSNSSSSSSSSRPTPPPLLSSTTKTQFSAVTRAHGRMLVLTRPTPKPQPEPQPQPQQPPPQPQTEKHLQPALDQPRNDPDPISLRPLGRTGTAPSPLSPVLIQERDKELLLQPTPLPKSDRFVPPHLRPGFAGREVRPGPEVQKQPGFRPRPGQFGSPNRYGEDRRPKSGGYDRGRRIAEPDSGEMIRPNSGGDRPSSSG